MAKILSLERAKCYVNVLLIIQRHKETVNVSWKILWRRRQEILLPAFPSWPNKRNRIDVSPVVLDEGRKSRSIKCIFHHTKFKCMMSSGSKGLYLFFIQDDKF